MHVPVPEDEQQRLEVLESYDILDSAPEKAYDELAYLAAYICDTPISAISLIGEDRQWFKSTTGVEADQTPREDAFCAHAIVRPDEVLVVEDATTDPRFKDNPMVTGNPEIRFYAGAPLKTREGHALGTVCAIDTEPRQLTEDQRRALEALSDQIMVQLQLRRKGKALAKAKEELDELTEELQRSNRELDRFASMVSHELKEPMGSVLSNLDLVGLLAGDDLEDQAREGLASAMASAERMEQLVTGLLGYARIQAGELETQAIDLEAAAKDALANLEGRIEASDAWITVEPLPAVKADPALVCQVLQNLVANAIKYSDQATPSITLRAKTTGDEVRVEVEDDGPGIPEGAQADIFELFTRVDEDTEVEGTGLGLALCSRVIDLHGGRIGVASELGQGSTFWFTLPAAQA